MKKIIKNIAAASIVLVSAASMVSCGTALSGDPVQYSDPGDSFSVSLPTSGDDSWQTAEHTDDDVLDITDKNGRINIQVMAMSKSKAVHVASDLQSFSDYVMSGTLSDIASELDTSDESVDVPSFITDSRAQSFTMKNGGTALKGDLIFMESSGSYYMYMITAVEKNYDSNKKALQQTVSTLQEK